MRAWACGFLAAAGLAFGQGRPPANGERERGEREARAPEVLVPNGGFEAGGDVPEAWVLAGAGGGRLAAGGVGGGACVAVEGGAGGGSGAWQTAEPVAFQPAHVYRLTFSARGEGAAGGTAVSGPAFANVDIGVPGPAWRAYSHVFAAPVRKELLAAPLRLGCWELKGRVLFDEVRLVPVEPVHAVCGGLALGEGESLEGNRYLFEAPLATDCRNHSRPLLWHTAAFNTDRWCFNEGAMVSYRHALEGRRWRSGRVTVSCGYYVSGALTVEVSPDAKEWQPLGAVTNTGSVSFEVPAALLPAEALHLRLRGARPPCNLQVNAYAFEAEMDGEPAAGVGSTRYLEVEGRARRGAVRVTGLGELLPGAANAVSLLLQNPGAAAVETEARVSFRRPEGGAAFTNACALTVPGGGASAVEVPYEVPGVGLWEMRVEVGSLFSARSAVRVPEYYADGYGELLPLNQPRLAAWRASSGWKVPRRRGLPRAVAKTLALRLARNEREATQLVLVPAETLSNVTVRVSDLAYARHVIAASNVAVSRVAYVPVTRPTDATGVRAEWPDPLVPQDAPAVLAAGENQPYWLCVYAPAGTPAGVYRGTVTVEADGLKASVVLSAEVYDLTLPDAATCETAFGFSPQTVWRYHNVSEPAQRREVLDQYLRKLGESRISPYNPAPLDGWRVTWKGLNPWTGGVPVTNAAAEGRGSLFVLDDSAQANRAAAYPHPLPLPKQGLRIAFKHKATAAQAFLVSLSYLRADGTWLPGRNTDLRVQGAQEWQAFEATHAAYPEEAASARLAVWAAGYQEPGAATGGLWLDAFSVTDLDTGRELVEGGAFEPLDAHAVEPVFEWEAWDAAMTRALTEYGFNTFMIHVEGLGGGTFHERYEPQFLGYTEDRPEYDILLGKYLKGIEAHLREKGWLDKAYVYWFDEPDPKDYAFVMGGFDKLKRHAPGLRRLLTEQVEPALAGGPNLWVPLTPSLNVAGLEERRAAGDQFWWYVCCVPKAPYATEFIDKPGTELRVWLWQTWAERVTGILIWETVYWTSGTAYPDQERPQNPYLDPMSWVSGYGVAPGTRQPWGNGDGRFLYPPAAAADGRPAAPVLDGPAGSLRLEMLRDGIEDYEYFARLRSLLREKGAALDPLARAAYERLLEVPKAVSESLTRFTADPAPLEAHRDALARAIVELQKR